MSYTGVGPASSALLSDGSTTGFTISPSMGGSLSATTTITSGMGITATTGDIVASLGDLIATTGALNVGAGITSGNGITAATGDLQATTGNINSILGSMSAGTTITAGTGITATTGNIVASAGQVNANTTMTAGTGITATLGNITSSAGDIVASTAAKGVVLGGGAKVVCGTGDPNTVVTAPKGSLYLNLGGSGVADRAFINTDSATAWAAITTTS